MIQRIQTIFLLITAILMAVTVFSPLAELTDEGKLALTFFSSGIGIFFSAQYPTWGVLTFALLGGLLPLVNIFMYKNRKLQMKLGTATSLIIIAFYVTFYVYLNSLMANNSLNFEGIGYGITLPAIALIFNILAILRIKKDEKLVQSLNRIR
ncbi:DUF4293 domain-containing protein [Dysgonomonas sp. OttesenSCG-928-M03]|nr:DUF4293 domain-containing protein [Dysgonomonas sp. OttesenSCG-928-M03]